MNPGEYMMSEDVNFYPASDPCERGILGAIMLDNSVLSDAVEKLCAEDFSLDSHRRIFLCMKDMNEAERSIDTETLANELRCRKEIEAIGGTPYLMSLTEGLPRHISSIDEYIRIVKDKAILRSLIHIAEQMQGRAAAQSEAGLEVTAWASSALETLIETGMGVTEAASSVQEGTVAALQEFDRRRDAEHDETLPYGMMPDLDQLTGGMFPGEVTVVGGESGVGKSSAMIQALIFAGRRSVPAVCYSLEMTRQQVLGRMWAILSGVPYRFVRFPRTASKEQAASLRNAAFRISDWPLHIYDRASMTISEIVASSRIHIARRKARLIAVDYLQRIAVPGQKDVRLQISQAAMRLAQAVKGTPAHMMVLSQLKRREDNGFPQMKDLRESGQIENEAHTIALLWREYDKEQGHHLTSGKVIVPKNRFGLNGIVSATFNTDYAIFE
jgi:replicative DNA helicase